VCGTVVGALLAAVTRNKENESFGEAFTRGAVTGFIAGAALDISIATAGVGTAVAIAVGGGSVSAAIDYGWEQHNKGEVTTASGYAINAAIGGSLNLLFMGAGREAANAVGNSIKSIGKAIWDNTIKSVTNKAGKVIGNKVATEGLKNISSSAIQGSFEKMFSIVFTSS